jgi:hypothetical protein
MARSASANQVRDLKSSVLHLTLYSVLLLIYFLLVLRYWSGWLKDLFLQHRHEYAIVAILLMIVQAVGLEAISFSILKRVRGGRDESSGKSPLSHDH